jgi:AcrR family transcriptional regulator
MAEPLTPDRRRENTRRALLDAAAGEFATNGFHGASLDAVAAAAGFTKGAVYSNFENKADLFLAVLDDRMERQTERLTVDIVGEGTDDEARLARIQDTVADLSWGDEWASLWLEFVLYAARNPDARARAVAFRQRRQLDTEQMIAEEYERHGVRPSHPVPLLAQVSLAMFDGLDVARLIDPIDDIDELRVGLLAYLYDTIGVHDPPEDSAE